MAVNWGVIGAGGIANGRMIPEAFLPEENVNLLGVADVNQKAADETAERWDVKSYDNVEALLSDPDIEAVYIPVPPFARAEVTIMAARFGKHVLAEKPLAMTGAECEQMIKVCRENNVQLGTGFMMRHHSIHMKMKELIDAGAIGKPAGLHARYCLWVAEGKGKSWILDPEIVGGGPLQNQGSHAIDICNMMLGNIRDVNAFSDNVTHNYDVPDMETLLVRFENGAHGNLDIWYGVPNWYGRRLLEVFGSEGILRAEEPLGQLPGGTLYYQKAVDGGQTESVPEEIPVTPQNTYRAQVREFSKAIESGEQYSVSGEQGLHVQRVIDAATQSSAQGRTIPVDIAEV